MDDNVVSAMIVVSIGLGALGLCAFLWGLKTGQFDDKNKFLDGALHDSEDDLNVAKKTPDNKMFINKYLQELAKKWGLRRIKKYHWDNVREFNGQIFLIDFGSIPIKHAKKGVSPSREIIHK